MSLEGRGFVVTGGATAHGRAVALAAAQRGATVVFSVPPGSAAVAAEIQRSSEGRATGIEARADREEDTERLFGVAAGRLTRLDAVVVAAPVPEDRALGDVGLSQWQETLASVLKSAFLVSRSAVEEFLAHGGGGHLVHVVPGVREGASGQVLAAAALQSLLSLMRSTAKEYGPRGICCNAVVPAAGTADAAVAEAALFLASPAASYVNGEAVRLGSVA